MAVLVLDVSAEEADLLLAALDPIGAMARTGRRTTLKFYELRDNLLGPWRVTLAQLSLRGARSDRFHYRLEGVLRLGHGNPGVERDCEFNASLEPDVHQVVRMNGRDGLVGGHENQYQFVGYTDATLLKSALDDVLGRGRHEGVAVSSCRVSVRLLRTRPPKAAPTTMADTSEMEPLLVTFAAGSAGPWRVERFEAVRGDGLPLVERLAVIEGRDAQIPEDSAWTLRGVTSNERYVGVAERAELVARQEPLGRPEATRAALIPVSKSSAWWDLTQEERRGIFAEQSGHVRIGLEYLPAVARRLHHGRDLAEEFDFLTWFEYPAGEAEAFEELVGRLRDTPEWDYVEREIDIRLVRSPGAP